MHSNNGNGNGGGDFNIDNFLGKRLDDEPENTTVMVDVVAKFKNYSKFHRDITETAISNIGGMILHIHPKYIDVEQDSKTYKFRITINMDKTEE